ncbi:MAG: hypothetical protein JW784_01895 [Candidatus Cloacimonetes bacterium]|nr:hypothetical protein [Candidatus Cloacimonadota bacterium]
MFIYKVLSLIIFLLLKPYFHLKMKSQERQQRFGHYGIELKRSIWIHAASVGEVNAVKSLVQKLLNLYPQRDFVLSTMTRTGFDTAAGISPKLINIFLPLDVTLPMKRAFNSLNPALIILVETELWPVMLSYALHRQIPVVLVNGRLSPGSFKSYRYLKFFWKPLWRAVKFTSTQSDIDEARFRSLGFEQVSNNHNLKFCLQLPEYNRDKLRAEMGYSEQDFLLVWGSSRPGEEKLLMEAIWQLKKEIPQLKAVVAPRHLSRLPEIKNIFRELDFTTYSDFQPGKMITIIDEMNVLNHFYAIADLAVVGGSFFRFGGHNPLEPAFYGIPILMGHDYNSCEVSVNKLLENKGIMICSPKELAEKIVFLFHNPELRVEMGKNAKQTLTANSDSMKKNIEILTRFIEE